jgi:hypothetical protein
MNSKKMTAILCSVLVLVALALGGYVVLRQTRQDTCRICRRGIHAASRAVIEVAGEREVVCCARCALTLARQKATPVQLVEVNDYVTGRPLPPESAVFVVGSRVVLCEEHEPMPLDPTKRPYGRVFDRCEPSVYAFARRHEAEAFAAREGGVLRTFAQLLEEVTAQP